MAPLRSLTASYAATEYCALCILDRSIASSASEQLRPIGLSMRHLHGLGHSIHVAVLTSGANGVEDGWNGPQGQDEKVGLREAEQLESCHFSGYPSRSWLSCGYGKARMSNWMNRRAARPCVRTCTAGTRTWFFSRMTTIATARTGAPMKPSVPLSPTTPCMSMPA